MCEKKEQVIATAIKIRIYMLINEPRVFSKGSRVLKYTLSNWTTYTLEDSQQDLMKIAERLYDMWVQENPTLKVEYTVRFVPNQVKPQGYTLATKEAGV